MADKEELESMCKRRGFIWQSAEIYGGEAGFYDYGHLGAKLKDNWEDIWKDYFLGLDENYHMIYTPDILPYRVLKASGHVEQFNDILIRCERCGASYRADTLIEEEIGENVEWMDKKQVQEKILEIGLNCPSCGGNFSEPEDFNMMFSVDIGPTGDKSGFLRPETAQGTYINFSREFRALRKRMPLGLASVGKAFRNEISPRQGVYRLREFSQAELQIFFVPEIHEKIFEEKYEESEKIPIRVKRTDWDEAKVVDTGELDDLPKFYLYHLMKMYNFYSDHMGLDSDSIRLRELGEDERAFYNKIHFDVEIDFESLGGWKEVSGLHYRSDYDLSKHEKESGQKMSIPTEEGRKIPHVIELSFGIDRNLWALLDKGYHTGDRDWLDLPAKMAPFDAAVFPLVNKDGLPEKARNIFEDLREDLQVFWDSGGSIGRRYARQDEIGTPFCLTIDYDTLDDDTLTIRDINSTEQIRVSTAELKSVIRSILEGEKNFEEYLEN